MLSIKQKKIFDGSNCKCKILFLDWLTGRSLILNFSCGTEQITERIHEWKIIWKKAERNILKKRKCDPIFSKRYQESSRIDHVRACGTTFFQVIGCCGFACIFSSKSQDCHWQKNYWKNMEIYGQGMCIVLDTSKSSYFIFT